MSEFSKTFAIHETDLEQMERLLPELAAAVCESPSTTPKVRTIARKLKQILSDVRWNYGPSDQVVVMGPEDV